MCVLAPYKYTFTWLLSGQVLSESVSKALELTGGEEASETARFIGMVDKFFDAVNVHNYTHGVHSRKTFQMPYTSGKDVRLKVPQYIRMYVSKVTLTLCTLVAGE